MHDFLHFEQVFFDFHELISLMGVLPLLQKHLELRELELCIGCYLVQATTVLLAEGHDDFVHECLSSSLRVFSIGHSSHANPVLRGPTVTHADALF